jgi:hypothetical protein|tara:strand:+ start:414 stop:725 length:312 start_codon:yes stop_codon:yes gene_type:complete
MNDINKKEIEQTFKVLTQIVPVKVNPFFRHKILQEIAKEATLKQPLFSWLMPQLQLATLSLVLCLNIGAIFYVFSNSNETGTPTINIFAKEYALQTNASSILN